MGYIIIYNALFGLNHAIYREWIIVCMLVLLKTIG